jgi:tetratricopeptide (TPR) repeat protein
MKKLLMITLIFLFCAIPLLGQTEVEGLIKKSEELSRQDKFPEAIAVLTKAIEIQPENADLYVRRSQIYYGINKKDELLYDLRKAAALAPNNKEIILNSTHLLAYFDECADSLNILNNYIYKDSTVADVFNRRSQTKICLNDLIGAYDDISTAIALAPDNISYRSSQAALLPKLGDSKEAFERFSQLIKTLEQKLAKANPKYNNEGLKTDLSQVYQTRARVFHSKGDTEAEFADLAKYVEYNPKFYTYELRARYYIEHERYEEAITDFTEGIRISDISPTALLLQRGETYILMEKFAEAAADYEEALKLEGTVNIAILKQRLAFIKQKLEEQSNKSK